MAQNTKLLQVKLRVHPCSTNQGSKVYFRSRQFFGSMSCFANTTFLRGWKSGGNDTSSCVAQRLCMFFQIPTVKKNMFWKICAIRCQEALSHPVKFSKQKWESKWQRGPWSLRWDFFAQQFLFGVNGRKRVRMLLQKFNWTQFVYNNRKYISFGRSADADETQNEKHGVTITLGHQNELANPQFKEPFGCLEQIQDEKYTCACDLLHVIKTFPRRLQWRPCDPFDPNIFAGYFCNIY